MSEWARETPWRQGHLLTDTAVSSLGLTNTAYPNETVAIVATHDCDLAQAPEHEPEVEVVVGHRIISLDGNNTHAKSARTLHISFEGGASFYAEFAATGKYRVPKSVIVNFGPDGQSRLSSSGLATFQRWLASRYRRSAFPDEFERRLVQETKLAAQIAKAVKPHGELITAVLFDVDDGKEREKLGQNDVYMLDIILLHAAAPDNDRAASAAHAAKEVIQKSFATKLFDKKLGKWRSIELRYVDVISEEALTYRQFTLMKPWRLEYVSLGADPPQPIVVE